MNKVKKITPSQSPFPVFVMCAPTYADLAIKNNVWMTDGGDRVVQDKEKFMGEWYNLYELVSANGLVYLLPPTPGLQDQTYVNSFVYLPHIKTKRGEDIAIISNFTAEGRQGESKIAREFLIKLGYKVYDCPYKFEGYPELKYSGKDNIYYGGYGIRTDIRALEWIEEKFDAKIIKIKEIDPYLYHLDCSIFVFNKENVMVCTETIAKKTLRQIEKIAQIHSVTVDSAYQGINNSARTGDFILNASSLDYMKPTDKWYYNEVKKNKELEKICIKLGLELIYVSLSESMKGGALLSCHITPLTYRELSIV